MALKAFAYGGLTLLLLLFCGVASAQDPPPPQGLIYFAVENLDTQLDPRRGTSSTTGQAFTSAVFAADTRYRAWVLHASTLRVGYVEFTSGRNGRRFTMPPIVLGDPDPFDHDGDRLHDLGEFIIGIDPMNPDSDGDGVPDGAEVIQGTDPRPNSRFLTQGVIAAVDTPGTAQDVCAINDLAAVADGDAGVAIFNIFNGLNPKIIASVPTLFPIERVACVGRRIVAIGEDGVNIIDLSDPPRTEIIAELRELQLGGLPRSVTTAGSTAYVGLSSGRIAAIDVVTGAHFDTFFLSPDVRNITDLTIDKNWLYAVNATTLYVSRIDRGDLVLEGQADIGPRFGGAKRVFAANGVIWVTHGNGVDTFDVSQDPAAPIAAAQGITGEPGWRDASPNGANLLVGISGNARNLTEGYVGVYSLANPLVDTVGANTLDIRIDPPGNQVAVDIYNGLAYVASDDTGLQVINYRAIDRQNRAPTFDAPEFVTNFELGAGDGQIEEGRLAFVEAQVSDDVQLRNVEFYLNGEKVETDGNYPFQFYFRAPALDEGTITVRARASDTGGNLVWSEPYELTIIPDATRPFVTGRYPEADGYVGNAALVMFTASELLDPATITPESFQLTRVEDGFQVAPDQIEVREEMFGVFRIHADALPAGQYQVSLTADITDIAGLAIQAESWTFTVYDPNLDENGDGVPDGLEEIIGRGDEDRDGDGLTTAQEIRLGLDPLSITTYPNVQDGTQDTDGDGLVDLCEVHYDTDPFRRDSDGDEFSDFVELDSFDVSENVAHRCTVQGNRCDCPNRKSDPTDGSDSPRNFASTVVSARNDAAVAGGYAIATLATRNDAEPTTGPGFALPVAACNGIQEGDCP